MSRPTAAKPTPFRLHRQALRLSVQEIAEGVGFTPSYVSGVELGRYDPPSARFLEAYKRAFGLPPDFSDPGMAPVVLKDVLDIIAVFRSAHVNVPPVPEMPLTSVADLRQPLSERRYYEEVGSEQLLGSALNLLERARGQGPRKGDSPDILHISQGRHILIRHPSGRERWNHLLSDAMYRGWNFQQYLRRNGDRQYNLELLRHAVEDTLRHSLQSFPESGKFKTYFFTSSSLKNTPYDFLIVPNQSSLLFLTSYKHAEVDSAIMFDGVPGPLEKHCNMIVRPAGEGLEFFSEERWLEFSNVLGGTDEIPGDRLVVQPFLSSVTRPFEDLDKDTRWYQRRLKRLARRYEGENSQNIVQHINTLIQHRRDRIRAMERQLSDYRYKQICSLDEILFWAQNGYGSLTPEQDREMLKQEPSERIDRIERVLELLEYKNFEIAFVDKEDRQVVSFDRRADQANVSWMVKSSQNRRVLIEASYLNAEFVHSEYFFSIYDRALDDDFEQAFNIMWDMILPKHKEKKYVIEVLKGIRDRLRLSV